MPHGLKIGNEYAGALGRFYTDTPKAVFAALAVSYVIRIHGDDATAMKELIARLKLEWLTLNHNGIVPQKVPNA